jgi:hypothetical protein
MSVLQTKEGFSLKIPLDSPASFFAKKISKSFLRFIGEIFNHTLFRRGIHCFMEILTAVLLFINLLFTADAPLSEAAMVEFGSHMAPYYEILNHPTDTSRTSLHELPETYWGATVWSGRCTNQVFLSQRFADPRHPFYGTAMWKYVLAHEWAHVAQGVHCWENEAEAQLIAMAALAEAGEWDALYTVLEWMLALSASEEVISQLQLTERETRYYHVVGITQLEAVQMLLNDEDGIFELRTGLLDARLLWEFLQNLVEDAGGLEYSGAR